jgi:protein-S-isoprenylcysteine O-methyltransferase Ste14
MTDEAIDETLPLPALPVNAHTPVLFRFRVFIFTALYFLGFYAPWSRLLNPAKPMPNTWLELADLGSRTGLMTLSTATVFVTISAICCALAGAWLRLWATAYIGAGVMNDKSLRADHVMASGPYRYLRNPLYLGNMLTCVSVCILMPVDGALVFLAGCILLTLALVGAEGPHLAQQLGSAYATYRAQIPSFLPAIRSQLAASTVRPRWIQALAAEIFHVGFAVCLVIFAWQYNVEILIRCLLICFGLALVANGMLSSRDMRPAAIPPA